MFRPHLLLKEGTGKNEEIIEADAQMEFKLPFATETKEMDDLFAREEVDFFTLKGADLLRRIGINFPRNILWNK